ncbi:MAG TPA: hypothetical protein VGB45_09600 [Abditibacterium sp.]|jgi:hypothetical protein
MKPLFTLAAALLLPVLAHAQNETSLSVAKVPLRADAPMLFAPRGWKIEKQINGDLNRDKISDAALVLVENRPAKDAEGIATARNRALVVVLREGKGFRRAGFNNSLLLGTRDGGAFYGVVETPVSVSIARGVLLVNQDSGSRATYETTHKFRLDRRTQRFYLIGFDSIENDRLSGETTSQSTNFLTGRQEIRRYLQSSDSFKTTKSRVSRKLQLLEATRRD